MASAPKKLLGSFALTMISVSAVLSLRNFPMMATLGLPMIGFYILAALCFLIPSALVCAELATTFPKSGGIYTWVKAAFGDRYGFLAIWMEWINNVVAFPTTLATIVATLAYLGIPTLQQNHWLLFALMMLIYWVLTAFNCLGIKPSSRLTIVGGLLGTIAPCVLIIALFIAMIFLGHHVNTNLFQQSPLPPWHFTSLVFFVGVLSSFSGMQVTAFHAQNVKNPRRDFPRSIFLATIIILLASTLGSLAIALMLPSQKIHLANGVIQAMSLMFAKLGITNIIPWIALLIALGLVASLNAWVISPARGLHKATQEGYLGKSLAKLNKHAMPSNILWLQALIVTALSLLFVLMPNFKDAFWMLVAITSQFTVLMYIFVFASAIRLRFKTASLPAHYKIPGGIIGVSIVGLVGIIACAIGFLLGLLPPAQLHITGFWHYVLMILAGDAIILIAPFLFKRR